MWLLADGAIDVKHWKVLIGNSDRAVESIELLELVFFLAAVKIYSGGIVQADSEQGKCSAYLFALMHGHCQCWDRFQCSILKSVQLPSN